MYKIKGVKMNNTEESIQDGSKTMKEIALNYLEHYVYPIPLFIENC